MDPVYFETQAKFRAWLKRHHGTAQELWVGYHKKATGRPSMTWNESVDVALCFGWIDGIRKSVDEARYTIRFTPRKPNSIWSNKNIRRMEELLEAGAVHEAGVAAWERRVEDRSRRYSFEQDGVALPEDYEARLRSNRKAWAFFREQAPYYRRAVTWWVISAKRESTRERRLDRLIRDCAAGERIREMRRTTDPA